MRIMSELLPDTREAGRGSRCCAGSVCGRSWQALLLTANILSSCFLLIQAPIVNISISLDPPNPVAGKNITLWPEGTQDNVLFCRWYRGEITKPKAWIFDYHPDYFAQENGDAYTERENGGPDCSMHITHLQLGDTGNYTVIKGKIGEAEKGHVFLEVLVPEHKKKGKNARGLSVKITSGVAVGSLLGLMFIAGLISCWHFNTSAKKKGRYPMKRSVSIRPP